MGHLNLINSRPSMRYPRAGNWLREKAKTEKLDRVYNLQLIEEVTAYRDFEEYINLEDRWRVDKFRELFEGWLQNRIAPLDEMVYSEVFRPGQHIRYFRDYFKDTREEESYSSRGNVIVLKAYGDSLKIDREVIAFEGRFLNGELTSFKDKTGNSTGYEGGTRHTDEYHKNDLELLRLLIEHECVNILSNEALEGILKDPSALKLLHGCEGLDPETRSFANMLHSRYVEARRSEARRKIAKRVALAGLLITAGVYLSRSRDPALEAGSLQAPMTDSSLTSLLLDTLPDGTTFFISPGEYLVETVSKGGAALYTDPRRRKRLRTKAVSGSSIKIEKVNGEMGFFQSYTGSGKRKAGKGWIEMRYLVPK